MKQRLEKIPLFVVLLPVFFVFHRLAEYAAFVSFSACLPVLGSYLLAALVLFLLFRAMMRNTGRAALVAFYVLAFYLYFGVLHDFLRRHGIIHRYSLLLPLFAASVPLLWFVLRKKSDFSRVFLFLNTLLILYLLVDIAGWAWREARRRPPASLASTLAAHYPVASGPRPDIYLLLFDEYSSSATLKEVFHYDNSGLDTFLRQEGFHILGGSRSNYDLTPFSMASILNLSYLEGPPHPLSVGPEDYLEAMEQIGRSEVVKFLMAQGYTIVNNSPFDLPGHPARIDQPFIPARTRLITYTTLYDRVRRDLGGALEVRFAGKPLLPPNDVNHTGELNTRFLADTKEESRKPATGPRFVYMHVLMPHRPYFYDSGMHRRPWREIDPQMPNGDPERYLQYIPYTNTRIRELIGEIRKNTAGRAVILFLSDHGFRYSFRDADERYFFRNQNAVYIPGGDGSCFSDSICGVNQFRVLFNKLFGLNLPLLKDSSVILHDRPDKAKQNDSLNP